MAPKAIFIHIENNIYTFTWNVKAHHILVGQNGQLDGDQMTKLINNFFKNNIYFVTLT